MTSSAGSLRISPPDIGSPRGFSRRNLFYMRRFAAIWPGAGESASHWLHKSAGRITRC